MTDTAALSVIFSGTVGMLGLAVTALGQWRTATTEKQKVVATQLEEDRKRLEARREDLQGVIAGAAKTAMSVRLAASAEELGDRKAAVEEIRDVIVEAQDQLALLGVRVGPDHELYGRYQDVTTALNDWRAARARSWKARDHSHDKELASAESKAAAVCKNALEQFLRAAKSEIGSWQDDSEPERTMPARSR